MDCLFCQIAAKSIPSEIVFEDEQVLAFKDIHPKADVHILIIPKRHYQSLAGLTEADSALMGHLLLVASRLAKELGIESGFKLAVNNGLKAGQEVDHLHFHIMGGRLHSHLA
jgi:histidine triad (HIT) family protein